MNDVLETLTTVIEQRRKANPNDSYVAKLLADGVDEVLRKVGEEATETILAAKNGDKAQIIHETADLWFHTLVMLAQQNLDVNEVLHELEQRFGLSGLEEKRRRQK